MAPSRRASAVVVLVVGLLAPCVVSATDAPRASNVAGGGLRDEIAPATPASTVPPTGSPRAAAPAGTPPSHDGLVEEPDAGGGVMVNLGDHLMQDLTSTVDPDGTVHTQCQAAGPPHPPGR